MRASAFEWIRLAQLARQIERDGYVWSIQYLSNGYTAQVALRDIDLGDCDMPSQETPSAALRLAISVAPSKSKEESQ